MTWKPRHKAHAIERVRVMFPFREPLNSKVLSNCTNDIVSRSAELGFDTVESVESAVATINFLPSAAPAKKTPPKNGIVLKRHENGTIIEEVGFRDGAFGYVTTVYGRWENLRNRMSEIILPALHKVENFVDLTLVKLEYWDTFLFDGNPNEADTAQLLAGADSGLPKNVLAGASQWHSHIGWFEGPPETPILINRNIDVADRINEIGTSRAYPLNAHTHNM